MSGAYYVSVTIHVLAAMLWLGGMFFLALVGAPVLRGVEPALRQQLFHQLGLRARTVGWWSIAVLLVTGVLNLYFRGLLHWDGALGSAAFWGTSLGRALGAKLVVVAGMLIASALHDFRLGPAAGAAEAGSPRAVELRRHAMILARVNALLAVALVIAAVRLARG